MLTTRGWQLEQPINAIIFDCDGTLSTIEGIDELAKMNQVGDQVEALTATAMSHVGMSPELYRQRLELVGPKQDQLTSLGEHYHRHQVQDISVVIQLLQRLGKEIYIVSAGLNPAVTIFGERLQIPRQQIYAVDVQFDEQGRYKNFDTASPLIQRDGKRHIAMQLKEKHQTIAHIGDGMNDFVTYDLVTRFIGYGGVYYREHLATHCEYYLKTLSLSPLLPLLLTQQECLQLTQDETTLYQKGLALLTV